jgi:uncharacterized protein (DUF58 family)
VSPTPRAAALLGLLALLSLVLPLGVVALAALALAVATALDALSVRESPAVSRSLGPVLSRGVPAQLAVAVRLDRAGALRVRQPPAPGLELETLEGAGEFHSAVVARTRGRHSLPELGVRAEGRLGLGACYRRAGGSLETRVYPDLPAARRLVMAAREGRLPEASRRALGPLGLATDFASVREWLPDDDVRHVNWRATQRLGRLMTNQYQLEQARDLVFLIDAGRLMAASLRDRTRLDAALDAVTAVALTADELGDHCGATAFDATVRATLPPRRRGGRDIVSAFYDLQPRLLDSDYEHAFRSVAGGKRTLVFVFTDLFDEAAARALVDAVPVLARRHAVLVATVTDPDIEEFVTRAPQEPRDVYGAAAALDLLDSRSLASTRLKRAGAKVVEASPEAFATACVRAYLAAKASLRI